MTINAAEIRRTLNAIEIGTSQADDAIAQAVIRIASHLATAESDLEALRDALNNHEHTTIPGPDEPEPWKGEELARYAITAYTSGMFTIERRDPKGYTHTGKATGGDLNYDELLGVLVQYLPRPKFPERLHPQDHYDQTQRYHEQRTQAAAPAPDPEPLEQLPNLLVEMTDTDLATFVDTMLRQTKELARVQDDNPALRKALITALLNYPIPF